MKQLRVGVAAVLVLATAAVFLLSQDRGLAQDNPKLKGFLPANYGKLGLSDDQKQQIYKIQADYQAKIDDLQAKLDKMRKDEKADCAKVLTDAQRARLKEIQSGETPPKDKSPAKDKPAKDK